MSGDHGLIDASPPAIVIGSGSANGLGITQNLGRQGIPVYCVTSNPSEITCKSRYCDGTVIVHNVEEDANTLERVLTQLAHHIPERSVLFPTSDTTVLLLAKIQRDLEHFVTFIPEYSVVETLVIKTRFYPSLQRYGVPHPQTFSPEDTPLDAIMQRLSFPMYIRPAQSLLFAQHFRHKGFVVHNQEELHTFLAIAEQARVDVLVQEVIPGPTSEGYILQGYFNQQSQPIVIVAAQKLRQPTMFSNQSVQVSIPPSSIAECIQSIVDYFQQIQYRGLFGAEFKRDPRDGQLKLLEVNARSMGGNRFETACGANDILAAYRDVLGYKVMPMLRYETGVYFIDEIEELGSILSLTLQRQLSFRALLHPYRATKKTLNYLSREDPLPYLTKMTQIFRQLPSRFITSRARI
jgi:predicted ATP-grasp superfamily ATP-dependent carboligase